MDRDLTRAFLRAIRRPSTDIFPDAVHYEWPGTGRCVEAQADGVPCRDGGRSCDRCAKAAQLPGRTLSLPGGPAPVGPGEFGPTGP